MSERKYVIASEWGHQYVRTHTAATLREAVALLNECEQQGATACWLYSAGFPPSRLIGGEGRRYHWNGVSWTTQHPAQGARSSE